MYNITRPQSRGLARMKWREAVEYLDELIYEPLTIDTEEQMLEVFISEVCSAARIAPKLEYRHMRFFFFHTLLDCRMEGTLPSEAILSGKQAVAAVCKALSVGKPDSQRFENTETEFSTRIHQPA